MPSGADVTKKWSGYSESWTSAKGEITETVTCAWDDRSDIMADLWGYAQSDYSTLKLTAIEVAAVGDAASGGGPETALLTLKYKQQGGSQAEETIINDLDGWREQWEGGGEAITVGDKFSYGSTYDPSDQIENTSAVKLFPEATITMSGMTDRLDVVGKGKILNLLGKINSADMTLKTRIYSAKHLLFLSANLQEQDSDVYSVVYKFSYRPDYTWNEVLNKVGGWEECTSSDNKKMYESDAFADLDPATW